MSLDLTVAVLKYSDPKFTHCLMAARQFAGVFESAEDALQSITPIVAPKREEDKTYTLYEIRNNTSGERSVDLGDGVEVFIRAQKNKNVNSMVYGISVYDNNCTGAKDHKTAVMLVMSLPNGESHDFHLTNSQVASLRDDLFNAVQSNKRNAEDE